MSEEPAPWGIEILFECECELRRRAREYAAASNEQNRKSLRDIARIYSKVADDVEAAMAERGEDPR